MQMRFCPMRAVRMCGLLARTVRNPRGTKRRAVSARLTCQHCPDPSCGAPFGAQRHTGSRFAARVQAPQLIAVRAPSCAFLGLSWRALRTLTPQACWLRLPTTTCSAPAQRYKERTKQRLWLFFIWLSLVNTVAIFISFVDPGNRDESLLLAMGNWLLTGSPYRLLKP